MNWKPVFLLLFGAALCLPMAACGGKNPAPAETEGQEETVMETAAAVETAPTTTPPEPEIRSEAPAQPEPEDGDFAAIAEYVPDILVELQYASPNNFTGQIIYDFQDAFLRYGTVKKLMAAQEELQEVGLRLKIWDAFRPVAAQFRLWEACPDSTYVANPETGYSNHSRGNAVDVTLVDENGQELEMPTGFDDFSALADRNYSDCSETAAQNASLLQSVMEAHGFSGYFGEWWHFADSEAYPVEEQFQPTARVWYYADCQEFISLRLSPDTGAETLVRIPRQGELLVFGWHGDFALVRYQGLWGYVLKSVILPVS